MPNFAKLFSVQIGLCTHDPGTDFCHIFPLPPNFNGTYQQRNTQPVFRPYAFPTARDIGDYPICSIPGVQEVCDKIFG